MQLLILFFKSCIYNLNSRLNLQQYNYEIRLQLQQRVFNLFLPDLDIIEAGETCYIFQGLEKSRKTIAL